MTKLNYELQTERRGDATERLEARSASSAFEPGNRRLRAADAGRELRLSDAEALSRFAYLFSQFEGCLGLSVTCPTFFAGSL